MSGDEFREWDAAYVLGMLSPDDRRAFERHLTTCEPCSASVAELAGLPGILSALSTDEAVALTAVPDAETLHDSAHEAGLVQRLAAASVRRRRRVRWRIGGAAVLVAAAVAVGAFFVGSAATAPARAPAAVAMTPLVQHAVTANLAVTPKKWGTRLDWNCRYAKSFDAAGAVDYDLVVTNRSGTETVVATWTAYGDAAKNLSASTSVPATDIRSVEIRLEGSTAALARAEL
ncbi:zf-HC2 domain-containing protein [soil metagenome]